MKSSGLSCFSSSTVVRNVRLHRFEYGQQTEHNKNGMPVIYYYFLFLFFPNEYARVFVSGVYGATLFRWCKQHNIIPTTHEYLKKNTQKKINLLFYHKNRCRHLSHSFSRSNTIKYYMQTVTCVCLVCLYSFFMSSLNFVWMSSSILKRK